ncbi:MAG: hypothetical protein KKA05_09880 [Alphaproteobacteria bacterium]|nr:hypothetical protein [Alphaproteobacteria bacterium]
MGKPINDQLMEKVPYFKQEFSGCIPTTEQLEAKAAQLTKHIFIAQLTAMAFATVLAVIAYLNAWVDPGIDVPYMVFNKWCLFPLSVGCLILGFAKLHTDRVKTLRKAFMRSNTKLISFDPSVQNYLDAVIQQGRKYLTNYESYQLFPLRETE